MDPGAARVETGAGDRAAGVGHCRESRTLPAVAPTPRFDERLSGDVRRPERGDAARAPCQPAHATRHRSAAGTNSSSSAYPTQMANYLSDLRHARFQAPRRVRRELRPRETAQGCPFDSGAELAHQRTKARTITAARDHHRCAPFGQPPHSGEVPGSGRQLGIDDEQCARRPTEKVPVTNPRDHLGTREIDPQARHAHRMEGIAGEAVVLRIADHREVRGSIETGVTRVRHRQDEQGCERRHRDAWSLSGPEHRPEEERQQDRRRDPPDGSRWRGGRGQLPKQLQQEAAGISEILVQKRGGVAPNDDLATPHTHSSREDQVAETITTRETVVAQEALIGRERVSGISMPPHAAHDGGRSKAVRPERGASIVRQVGCARANPGQRIKAERRAQQAVAEEVIGGVEVDPDPEWFQKWIELILHAFQIRVFGHHEKPAAVLHISPEGTMLSDGQLPQWSRQDHRSRPW